MNLLHRLSILALFLLVGVSPVTAQVIDQQNDVPWTSTCSFDPAAGLMVAQTFTVGLSGRLQGVDLFNGPATSQIVLELRTATGGTPDTTPASLLGTVTETNLAADSWHHFDFSAFDIYVEPGDRLALVIQDPMTTNGGIRASECTFAGGRAFRKDYSWGVINWASYHGPTCVFDWLFRSYVEEPIYQRNQAEFGIALDGVETQGLEPASVVRCEGELVALEFTGTPGLPYDLIVSAAPVIPDGQIGSTRIGDEIINIDLNQAWTFLGSGSTFPVFSPLAPATLWFGAVPGPSTLAAQGLAFDIASPSGVILTQAVQIATPSGASIQLPGPTGDDDAVLIDLGLCHLGGSIECYGTSYTEFFVVSNGRVQFGPPNIGYTASISEVLDDSPSVGFWSDFSPDQFGSITIDLSPGLVEVNFSQVPYYVSSFTNNDLRIAFQPGGGIDVGVSGVVPLTSGFGTMGARQWMGLSLGNQGATNAGTQTFTVGSTFTPTTATDVLHDFWNGGSGSAPGGVGLLQSIQNLQTGLGILSFVPTTVGGAPSYSAVGQ